MGPALLVIVSITGYARLIDLFDGYNLDVGGSDLRMEGVTV